MFNRRLQIVCFPNESIVFFPMQCCTQENSLFVFPYIVRTYAREDEICKKLFLRVLAHDLHSVYKSSYYLADRVRPRYETRYSQKDNHRLLGP